MLHHNWQGPNRLDILVVQRRCCPKSCDKRVRYGFVGQGGAPTLQENDKKTVVDFLGSQQKLGRRFKKDASVGMSGGCAWHKGEIGEEVIFSRAAEAVRGASVVPLEICRRGADSEDQGKRIAANIDRWLSSPDLQRRNNRRRVDAASLTRAVRGCRPFLQRCFSLSTAVQKRGAPGGV